MNEGHKYEPGKRILFACGRELAYPRNAQIIKALRSQYDVHSVTVSASRLTHRLARVGGRLLLKRFPEGEVCFIGFYGQPLVFPARIHWRGPLILDAFVSTYDTLCFDRQVFDPNSIRGQLIFYLDQISCRMADIVIVDTKAQANYFEQVLGVPRSKTHVLYVGCDDQLFSPQYTRRSDEAVVLFYGTFLPLHGVDVILRAAYRMREEQVRFVLIGRGQEYHHARALALELGLGNVEFLDPVPLDHLPDIIAEATICLGGHFGHSSKAGRVIAGKTFQCMSMKKPTILGDNPANRELFTHGENAWMCPMHNPIALADAIKHLLDSPKLRIQLGENARETILNTSGNEVTVKVVKSIVEKAIAVHQNGSSSN